MMSRRLFALPLFGMLLVGNVAHAQRLPSGAGIGHSHGITTPAPLAGPEFTATPVPRATSSSGLTIVPVFDATITSDANSAAIQSAINSAVAIYQGLFADPVTVTILFRYSPNQVSGSPATDLANSAYGFYSVAYANYLTALRNRSATPSDSTALSNLPATAPAARVEVNTALGRALGLNTPGFIGFVNNAETFTGSWDGIVSLNSAKAFQFSRTGGIAATKFDAQRLIEHEIDEVLGLGSILPNSMDSAGNTAVKPHDLFRYATPGVRGLSTGTSVTAWFSLDGQNKLVDFNQNGTGDYGDWLSPACAIEATVPLVQYASTCTGTPADLSPTSPEAVALDVIGYELRTTAPSIRSGGVVPIYSSATTIQPGEWVSIYGANLADSTVVWNGDFPVSLGGTSVTINGKRAYLYYVSAGQIDLQAPDDGSSGPVMVTVTTSHGSANSTVNLAQFAPAFSLLDSKHVAGIILRADGSGAYGKGTYDILGPTGNSLGYATVAARAGDSVALFGVGFGPTTTAVPAGQLFSGVAPAANPVNLLIKNVSVKPGFAGLSSAGLFQFNLTIPAGLGAGDVSLSALVGGVQTPANVVISLQ